MHSQLYLLFLLSSLTITFAFEAGIVMVNKLPHAEQFKHGNIQAAIKWGNVSRSFLSSALENTWNTVGVYNA